MLEPRRGLDFETQKSKMVDETQKSKMVDETQKSKMVDEIAFRHHVFFYLPFVQVTMFWKNGRNYNPFKNEQVALKNEHFGVY